MGLQRMYMIPDGHAATDGAYVSYRAEELHALVALEASRAGAVVVGEDLGTVPEGVRERMARDRMLRTLGPPVRIHAGAAPPRARREHPRIHRHARPASLRRISLG